MTNFTKDEYFVLHLAKAGITRALTELKQDKNSYDSLSEDWYIHPLWQDERWFKDEKFSGKQPIQVDYQVIDEKGKININTASIDLLMGLPGITEQTAFSIIDWRDPDDITGSGGAEAEYYQTLDYPYKCKNKPFDLVSELLLVKGINEEIVYGKDDGTSSLPDDNMGDKLQLGIKDLVTVYGDGSINLNTAPFEVISAIPGVTQEIARSIINYRSGPDQVNGTKDDIIFEKIEDLQIVPGMTEYEYYQLKSISCFNSDYFSINSQASIRGGKVRKKVTATLNRTEEGVNILLWQED